MEEVVTPEEEDVAAPAADKEEEVATETPEVKEAPAALEDDPPLEVVNWLILILQSFWSNAQF